MLLDLTRVIRNKTDTDYDFFFITTLPLGYQKRNQIFLLLLNFLWQITFPLIILLLILILALSYFLFSSLTFLVPKYPMGYFIKILQNEHGESVICETGDVTAQSKVWSFQRPGEVESRHLGNRATFPNPGPWGARDEQPETSVPESRSPPHAERSVRVESLINF